MISSNQRVTLTDVSTWHSGAWRTLKQSHEQNRLGHALLLSAPKGVGAEPFAKAFIHYLLCLKPSDGLPCGQCKPCMLYQSETHPDSHYVSVPEGKKSIGIDQVRELIDALAKTSQQGRIKTAFIEGIERMSVGASNALLKTLEEPSPNTFIILSIDSQATLLPTITSRCQQVSLKVPAQESAEHWLHSKKPAVEKSQVEKALQVAEGAPIIAYQYLSDNTLDLFETLDQLMEEGVESTCVIHWLKDVPDGYHVKCADRIVAHIVRCINEHAQVDDKQYCVKAHNRVISYHQCLEKLLPLRSNMNQVSSNQKMILEAMLLTWFEMTTSV